MAKDWKNEVEVLLDANSSVVDYLVRNKLISTNHRDYPSYNLDLDKRKVFRFITTGRGNFPELFQWL